MATAAVAQQSNGFLADLFAPLPEERAPAPVQRDGFDHVATYLDSTTGAWDLFRVIDHALEYVKNIPSLSDGTRELTSKISGAISLSGISLSIPAIFTEANSFRKKVFQFAASQDLPYSDGLRHQKIMQAGKGAVVSGMSLANAISQASLFLNEVKIVNLAELLPTVDFIYQGTSLVTDGAELIEEGYKINSYQSEQPRTPRETAELEEKTWLSWMVVIKDVASVATAAIALVGIVFGIAASSMAVVAPLVLVLTSVWLSMKIASYFYARILEDRRSASGVAGTA
ncbi:MAG: hypothetical protein KF898_02590 [Parachlamydiales bacterium]|nr:hypothetical protein [Candidatus Acheromyda pituitae]